MNRLFLIICTFSLLIIVNCTSASKIANDVNPVSSISTLEPININGVKQYVMIRSCDINNPILLYLHGGPGTSELPLIRHYNEELEKHFTVVYWEQRGTGKSFDRKIFSNPLGIEQFVSDGYELSKYILYRFGKEKLIIIGHSWGTIIATELTIRYPEIYHVYIGIGQVVNMRLGEQISYEYALSKATESNNRKAIRALKHINTPTYLTIDNNDKWYKQLKKQRKWLTYFGGAIYNQKDYKQFSRIYMKSPEYSHLTKL